MHSSDESWHTFLFCVQKQRFWGSSSYDLPKFPIAVPEKLRVFLNSVCTVHFLYMNWRNPERAWLWSKHSIPVLFPSFLYYIMARLPNMDNSTASASWVDQSLTVRTKLSNKQDADTCSSLSDSSLLCTDIKRDLSFCHVFVSF